MIQKKKIEDVTPRLKISHASALAHMIPNPPVLVFPFCCFTFVLLTFFNKLEIAGERVRCPDQSLKCLFSGQNRPN